MGVICTRRSPNGGSSSAATCVCLLLLFSLLFPQIQASASTTTTSTVMALPPFSMHLVLEEDLANGGADLDMLREHLVSATDQHLTRVLQGLLQSDLGESIAGGQESLQDVSLWANVERNNNNDNDDAYALQTSSPPVTTFSTRPFPSTKRSSVTASFQGHVRLNAEDPTTVHVTPKGMALMVQFAFYDEDQVWWLRHLFASDKVLAKIDDVVIDMDLDDGMDKQQQQSTTTTGNNTKLGTGVLVVTVVIALLAVLMTVLAAAVLLLCGGGRRHRSVLPGSMIDYDDDNKSDGACSKTAGSGKSTDVDGTSSSSSEDDEVEELPSSSSSDEDDDDDDDVDEMMMSGGVPGAFPTLVTLRPSRRRGRRGVVKKRPSVTNCRGAQLSVSTLSSIFEDAAAEEEEDENDDEESFAYEASPSRNPTTQKRPTESHSATNSV